MPNALTPNSSALATPGFTARLPGKVKVGDFRVGAWVADVPANSDNTKGSCPSLNTEALTATKRGALTRGVAMSICAKPAALTNTPSRALKVVLSRPSGRLAAPWPDKLMKLSLCNTRWSVASRVAKLAAGSISAMPTGWSEAALPTRRAAPERYSVRSLPVNRRPLPMKPAATRLSSPRSSCNAANKLFSSNTKLPAIELRLRS